MDRRRRRMHGLGVRVALAGVSAVLAGCFTGTFLAGKQCSQNADCGPDLSCVDGYCGGQAPATSEGPGSTNASASTSSGSEGEVTTGTTAAPETTEPLTSGSTSTTGAPVTGTGTTGPACTCDALDMLVIIDQSQSMEFYEDKVIAAFVELYNSLEDYFGQVCSYHIGFTFSSEVLHNSEECQGIGSLLRRNKDDDCSALHMGGRPYVNEEDDIGPALLCLASAGSTGDDVEQNPRPAETILNALSAELNAPGACNEGFFRPEAALAIALITDAEDDLDGDPMGHGSPDDPTDWFAELFQLNNFAPERMGMGAIVAPAMNEPMCAAGPAPRIHEFLDLFVQENTVRVNICDDEQAIAEQFVGTLDQLFFNTCNG